MHTNKLFDNQKTLTLPFFRQNGKQFVVTIETYHFFNKLNVSLVNLSSVPSNKLYIQCECAIISKRMQGNNNKNKHNIWCVFFGA